MTTAQRTVVYTAQSKQYFYCRDAVCEFVFRRGAIPLNPFRVFDYFLSDRVSRDAVRDANHEILQRSDEVWVFGEVIADGVLVEIAQAAAAGMPIRYFTIDNDVEAIREVTVAGLGFEHEVLVRSGLPIAELVHHIIGGRAAHVAAALGRHEEVHRTA